MTQIRLTTGPLDRMYLERRGHRRHQGGPGDCSGGPGTSRLSQLRSRALSPSIVSLGGARAHARLHDEDEQSTPAAEQHDLEQQPSATFDAQALASGLARALAEEYSSSSRFADDHAGTELQVQRAPSRAGSG